MMFTIANIDAETIKTTAVVVSSACAAIGVLIALIKGVMYLGRICDAVERMEHITQDLPKFKLKVDDAHKRIDEIHTHALKGTGMFSSFRTK